MLHVQLLLSNPNIAYEPTSTHRVFYRRHATALCLRSTVNVETSPGMHGACDLFQTQDLKHPLYTLLETKISETAIAFDSTGTCSGGNITVQYTITHITATALHLTPHPDGTPIDFFATHFRYMSLPQGTRVQAEYVWIGGTGQDLRCKTRTLEEKPTAIDQLPLWNYDGSSCGQAPGDDSEVMLRPVKIYPVSCVASLSLCCRFQTVCCCCCCLCFDGVAVGVSLVLARHPSEKPMVVR